MPTAVTDLAHHAGYGSSGTVRPAGISSRTVAACTIVGCVMIPHLADRFGRRATLAGLFVLMATGAVGVYGIAYPTHSIALTFAFLPVLGFGGANFAVFIHATGSLAVPLSATAIIFLLGIGLVALTPETRGQVLPD